jgi:D-arabinose 1-dehydrogenase-like Zn-dependent alcohol dehydrogenase
MYSFLQIAKENTGATCKVFKMKAVVTQEEKKAGVVEKEIPSITSDEVLVKVVAVALNPTDCT